MSAAKTDETATPAVTGEIATVRDILNAQPKVRIVIDQTGDESAPKRAFVGVNGYGFWIERGKPVDVPQAVVNVLRESVKTLYRMEEDERGNKVMVGRDVPAYPFHILPMAA